MGVLGRVYLFLMGMCLLIHAGFKVNPREIFLIWCTHHNTHIHVLSITTIGILITNVVCFDSL